MTQSFFGRAFAAAALAALAVSGSARAADPEVALVIKDHKFEPSEVKVPAGKKIKLIVDNQDGTAEEFESHSLNREKVIAPRSKATIFIGPLAPGKYPFIGEFHEATAKGVVIAE
ncbi:MAG: cupredoxin domain-containing protein [Casimicrobiaceae bacterium]